MIRCLVSGILIVAWVLIGDSQGEETRVDAKEIKIAPAPAWAASARVLSATCDDIGRLADTKDRFGATVVLLYAVGQTSNGWCPEASYERIGEFITRAHETELKVVCYFDTTLAEEKFFQGAHCEWAQQDQSGKPIHYQPKHIRQQRYAFCFNSPWSKYVASAASRYAQLGADGVFLDNPDYYTFGGKKSCFCANCQRCFKEETGGHIFAVTDDTRLKWLGKCLGEHISRVHGAMGKATPDRPLVVTANICGAGPIRNMRVLGPYLNVLFREVGGGAELRKTLEADLRACSGKPLWVIMTTPWGDPPETARSLAAQLEDVLGSGACPMVWATLPSWNPERPGFGETSIYSESLLGDVVKKFYLPGSRTQK